MSNEIKNVLKGNFVDVIKNDIFVRLYDEFEHLMKLNFGSNVIQHLNNFLDSNPFE